MEDLIHHDCTCVKHRIIEPEEALQEKYAQTVVVKCQGIIEISSGIKQLTVCKFCQPPKFTTRQESLFNCVPIVLTISMF